MFQHASKIVVLGVFGITALVIATPMVPGFAAGDASAVSAAQASHRGRGSFGFVKSLQTRVGLTPEQIDAVRGLLAEQRQESAAVREKTDAKIRAVLTPAQQTKFDAFLAELKTRHSQGS